jgi:hypothetical protein
LIKSKKIKSDFEYFQKLEFCVLVDHGRAGNMFFMRLFDQHPEVLVLARIGYFYSTILKLFDGHNVIDGVQAVEWLVNDSQFSTLCLEMSPGIEAVFRREGEDPEIKIDRNKVVAGLKAILTGKVNKRDVILATHFAYCLGTERNTKQFKYVLLNDSITGLGENLIFEAMIRDFVKIKFIHLVRDPRANFASLRHQYVNAYGSTYPLFPKRIFKSLPSNCVWLWVLFFTTRGALDMYQFVEMLDKKMIYELRIEDVNTSFVETMKKLVGWLDVCSYESWSDPEYIVTSIGKPWKGISAYKSYYQRKTKGPLANDTHIKNVFAKPDPLLHKKWKKHVFRREEVFLESIYYDEIKDYEYELQYIKNNWDKTLGLIYGLLPFSGEIPSLKWYFSFSKENILKDLVIKSSYLFVLAVSYFFARFQLYYFYFAGKLKTRPN